VRFYVPEWDDAVDAHYDFEHDELSSLNRKERNLDYIWDIFDRETTPIDGVLISREQVEETDRKAERLAEYGVYDDPVLSVPDWLPTISDCGAWGYKSLPFPPYGNKDMLDFYETLDVSVGVTIDHLVLGSGEDKGRLYLDKRAFHDDFKQSDLPDTLTDVVDVMADEWPEEWPGYVDEHEPTIRTKADEDVEPFSPTDFQGDIDATLHRLDDDPRAVYRKDDKKFRYELTLQNAQEMYDLYQDGEYPFRLMVAIQGWDPQSYTKAAKTVLEGGYDYLGIGGVAGSPIHEVRKIVKGVGKTVKSFEREQNTRVDSHVFGFAKTDGFESIGRSGMTSFDSASMLRSAWTGGENYRLDSEERYDAIRIRYPSSTDDLSESVEKSLRGREALAALRAYDEKYPLIESIYNWYQTAEKVLSATRAYLREHRHDPRYDESLLRDVESAFRNDFEYGRELQASFSDSLRGKIVKLLRKDDPEAPVPFQEYEELLQTAEREFEVFPRIPEILEEKASSRVGFHKFPKPDTGVNVDAQFLDHGTEQPAFSSHKEASITQSEPAKSLDADGDSDVFARLMDQVTSEPEFTLFEQIWAVVEDYANWIGDDHLLEEYQQTLQNRPWESCDCPICEEHGIEVCIFRGNDRNRRRGFHNTRRFYDQFADELPKILVATKGTASLSRHDTIDEYLRDKHPEFWNAVHDLPVAEVGALHGDGIGEWWDETPSIVSFAPDQMAESIGKRTARYQHLFLLTEDGEIDSQLEEAVTANDCTLQLFDDPSELRENVLETCGRNYSVGDDFVPHPPTIDVSEGLDVLVIDQCSGSKDVPDDAPIFGEKATSAFSKQELLNQSNVPGVAAKDLYTGRQQGFVEDAVRQLRGQGHDVDRYFISAGFGLVGEDELLPPYEVTFSSMNVGEIRERSKQLGIQEELQQLLTESEYDIVFFTLGSDYYTSIDVDQMVQEVPADRIGVVFNRESVDEQFENIVSVPARTADAKRHGTIVIGLKGHYMKNFAQYVGEVDSLQPEMIEDLCRRIDEEPTQPTIGDY